MATIRETISDTLARYNIELSEAEIDSKLIEQGLVPTDPFTAEASRPVKLAIVGVIPELLLMPDVTEGGYSVKYDKGALMRYYALLCSELGIPDKINPQPKIRSKSCIW